MLAACALALFMIPSARAAGILIPTEKTLPPLAMLNHHVTIALEDQVAVTRVEQTFRNHTDRQLEATYIFPVPKGASVRRFSMWVDGKEVPGELVEADKARKIYTDIVQRTLDPGLLEYMGNNLLKLRVFPVPPKGDQKISLSYTAVADSEQGLVGYVYPLKTEGKSASTLEKFSIHVDLRSQHALQNIYSPTHAITINRPSDKQALVGFEKDQAVLDRDFLLYYSANGKDVGLTSLMHRPSPGEPGYVMLLVSPRAELSKSQQVPRDMVFVLDTSGSMRGKRMTQARNALKYCLQNLGEKDRFAVLNFATTINRFTNGLQDASAATVEKARKWVDGLEATGGTAINDALAAALDLRSNDEGRTFTVVFFTDGRPTIGETNPEKIVKNVLGRNSAQTRIFTFGVGDDVNATMLDQLAEESRAVSTYVRETEDIEARVSSLYGKISNPVLTNLKLTTGDDLPLSEVYPPQLPDLFHGSQLVVLGRYSGTGHTAVKLTGKVGMETVEFVYELKFPDRTPEEKGFVEDLWARRKVGYLLDQIRNNGEKKELVEEVVTLAKRYGITTPYTSYLVIPDGVVSAAQPGPGKDRPNVRLAPTAPPALEAGAANAPAKKVEELARQLAEKGVAAGRGKFEGDRLTKDLADAEKGSGKDEKRADQLKAVKVQIITLDQAKEEFRRRNLDAVQGGQIAVNLSIQSNALRSQNQVTQNASRFVQKRNLVEVGGVWIDEGFSNEMKTVNVKAMSKAYFRMLERQPSVRDVFSLANYVVWVTPNGTALVVDQNAGLEEMTDEMIDLLFQVPAKKN